MYSSTPEEGTVVAVANSHFVPVRRALELFDHPGIDSASNPSIYSTFDENKPFGSGKIGAEWWKIRVDSQVGPEIALPQGREKRFIDIQVGQDHIVKNLWSRGLDSERLVRRCGQDQTLIGEESSIKRAEFAVVLPKLPDMLEKTKNSLPIIQQPSVEQGVETERVLDPASVGEYQGASNVKRKTRSPRDFSKECAQRDSWRKLPKNHPRAPGFNVEEYQSTKKANKKHSGQVNFKRQRDMEVRRKSGDLG
ncbi:hypothetical protein C8R45DRAFT_940627 [Mycena sanguinolenta]|nr:hypothetical protein C8R45DRAFT_940627 [Mycena sanguinolenta]